MISLRDVSFAYEAAEPGTFALRHVNLEIRNHEFLALLGPNGSGKSSLSRLLNGIEIPAEGTVEVDGLATTDSKTLGEIRRKVQIVFQNPENQQVGISVGEDIAFGLSNIGCPQPEMSGRIRHSLALAGLDVEYDRLVKELSGGEKQKLALAAVLALAPDYLILDEATSMLDPMARKQFVASLYEARRLQPFTLIYITHHLEEVLMADRLVLFKEGAVTAEGSPANILANEPLLAECGLELPFLPALALRLQQRGLPVPFEMRLQDVEGLL